MDFCYTDIIIEGAKDILQAKADRINAGGGLKSDVFAPAGFTDEDFEFNSCDKAEVRDAGGRCLLHLAAWIFEGESREGWEKTIFTPNAYYELHIPGDDVHWTNDAENKYFKEYELAISVEDKIDELKCRFHTEEDAVRFLKDNSPDIPKDLMSLDDINTYCMANDLDTLWYYGHTLFNSTCPPITTKVIQCLTEGTITTRRNSID